MTPEQYDAKIQAIHDEYVSKTTSISIPGAGLVVVSTATTIFYVDNKISENHASSNIDILREHATQYRVASNAHATLKNIKENPVAMQVVNKKSLDSLLTYTAHVKKENFEDYVLYNRADNIHLLQNAIPLVILATGAYIAKLTYKKITSWLENSRDRKIAELTQTRDLGLESVTHNQSNE